LPELAAYCCTGSRSSLYFGNFLKYNEILAVVHAKRRPGYWKRHA